MFRLINGKKSVLIFFATALILGLVSGIALAQVYIFANDGFTWQQYGTEWHTVNNDGYWTGSGLWKFKWSYNHSGCGYDEEAYWDWPSNYELNYYGRVYAWNDNSSYSNMYGADYNICYGGASYQRCNFDQRYNNESWVYLGRVYKPTAVNATDGWSYLYTCNGVGGYKVEFDEIKLEY